MWCVCVCVCVSVKYVPIRPLYHWHCPVGCGYRIHQLLLCREIRPPPTNEYLGYDTKQSDGEAPVMFEL